MPFIDNPGVSFIAFDPGETTGVAVFDCYTQELFVDQIDAGRGRRVRYNVWPHKRESLKKLQVQKQIGSVAGKGAAGWAEMMHIIESGVTQVMFDLIMAAGPRTIVVIEDFVVGWGNPQNIPSSGREVLSPVRLLTRLRQKCEDNGAFNGDAWRNWDGFGIKGQDGRGIKVVRSSLGKPMDFQQRLSDVERWRLGEVTEDLSPEERGLWAGEGVRWVQQMPSARFWLPAGTVVKDTRGREVRDRPTRRATSSWEGSGVSRSRAAEVHKQWLKERNQWRSTCPHAMDALLHMISYARSIGCDIPGEPRRIWTSGESHKNNRVTTKAAKPTQKGAVL